MSPLQKTYSLIFIIALFFSVIAYNLILLKETPQLIIKDIIENETNDPIVETIYYDLDNDSLKERIAFGRDGGDKSILYLVVAKGESNYIGQYNFKHSIMGMSWIGYADINNDSAKEIIAFYEKRDTIFTRIIDWKNDKYLAEDVFVLAKPDTIYDDTWSPILRVVGSITNTVGEVEIIFSIHTGFSQVPRGVFAFNTTSKIVTKKFVIGASIGNVKLFDLNKDGIDEIIINTNSSANNSALPKMPYYNDLKSWLIVLNANLDTLFSVCVDSAFGTFQSSYLIGNEENFLITTFSKGISQKILKINKNGEIVSQLILNDGLGYLPKTFYKENDKILIPSSKTLNVLDSDLNLVEKHKFSEIIGSISPFNLDSDSETEYLLWKQYGGISILDNDFSIIATIENKIKHNSVYSSLSHKQTKAGIKFILNSQKKTLIFTVSENPFYTYRFVLFLEILLIIYLIGILLHVLLNRLFVYLTLLDNATKKSNLGIMILSSKKKLNFVNKSAKNILSSKDYIIAKKTDLAKAIKNNKQLENFLEKATIELKEQKKRIHLINGKIIEINIIPIITPLGLPLAFYIQIDDLTEVLNSDRAKTLAHSIQKVAHEIKTPLSSVLLSLDSLEQNFGNPDKKQSSQDDFDIAREEIDRIKKFINGFLKFANMEGTQLQSYNLLDLINTALLKFSNYLSNGIQIEINVNSDINVLVDSYQIEEVFHVFIENCIDATKGKGEIIINAFDEDGKITISITDNGVGIEEELLPSIFQPYMTTKEDGTGMGLAIAMKILEDHGSDIKVNSILGKGTEFSFRLSANENSP